MAEKRKKAKAKKKAKPKAAPVVKKAKARAKAKPKPRARAAPAPKKKAKAKPKTKTKTKAGAKKKARKPSAAPAKNKNTKKPLPSDVIPAEKPSDRAMAIVAKLPEERPLTDEEREAMTKVAQTAHALLDGAPETSEMIVRGIGSFVDQVRSGERPEPRTQDERLGLGVLWGEQVRATAGWRWVHLSYADGFASYALVPDDRAFACFPLNRLPDLVRHASPESSRSVPLYALFDLIREGDLPQRRDNAYLVIG